MDEEDLTLLKDLDATLWYMVNFYPNEDVYLYLSRFDNGGPRCMAKTIPRLGRSPITPIQGKSQ